MKINPRPGDGVGWRHKGGDMRVQFTDGPYMFYHVHRIEPDQNYILRIKEGDDSIENAIKDLGLDRTHELSLLGDAIAVEEIKRWAKNHAMDLFHDGMFLEDRYIPARYSRKFTLQRLIKRFPKKYHNMRSVAKVHEQVHWEANCTAEHRQKFCDDVREMAKAQVSVEATV